LAGIKHIGENRVQEAQKKFESIEKLPHVTKRFIGTLQSNKVNKCIDLFDTIDSVDSIRLAKKIDKRSKTIGKTTPILLEVNTGKEKQKHGFWPDQVNDMIMCTTLKNINVKGLMTMGPRSKDKKDTRSSFALLRKIKEKINCEIGENQLVDLSMGMSADFEIGIEEGSTMVRIGTALFGPRPTQK
jgi:pyridoxal phosphate enzyme (YggS family)